MSWRDKPLPLAWFDARRLVTQVLIVTLLAGGLVTGLGTWQATNLQTALGTSSLPLAVLCATLLVGTALAWLAHRLAQDLHRIEQSMVALVVPTALPDAHVPTVDHALELVQLSWGLRRTVDEFRRREHALTTRNASLGTQLQSRTHELNTLQDLSIGLTNHSQLNELVNDALGALEKTVSYASASVWAREGLDNDGDVVLMGYRTADEDRLPIEALQQDLTGLRLSPANLQRYEQMESAQTPIVENNVRQSLLSWLWALVADDAPTSALYRATRSWMAVPLRFHDQVLGVMRIDHQEPGFFDPERVRLLMAVGSQAALAMRHTQLQAQGRELAVINERQRIARDLHDAVSQTLFASQVLSGTLVQSLRRVPMSEPPVLISQVQSLERLNRAALAEMRLLMYELRPDAIENVPLADLLLHTIDTMTTRGDLVVEHKLGRDVGLPPALRLHLYRIAQEALSNLVRHSGATRAKVEWTVHTPEHATLLIADNGVGFDPAVPKPGHFGLDNIRSRAEEIGAHLTVTTAVGKGTEILIQLH